MSKSPAQFAQAAQELCVLPDIYLKLTEMLANDECKLDDIADVISLEPAIAASLLKIANSAMFNFPKQIDSINKALILLGLSQVKKLVDAYGVTAAFSSINPEITDMERFWEISVECALICQFLAQRKKISNADNIFLSGLFHNLGLLAIVHNAPDAVQFCERYTSNETPWHRQQETFGFTFADCSAALLEQWQLPLTIVTPIKEFNHAFQEELDAPSNLLYVASRLAVYNSHPGLYSKKTIVGQHILDSLGLTEEDIDAAIEHCNEQALELLAAFPIY
ncbi:HDOD domain-containing protein [Thalassotalea euphylliae]|uniref:HDOD domain-containing protein n=1 Tax=Thalassotalea euphylliae TaxID=1655234 RepID=A0A3E0UKT3_9GAMM|nr:HDOD domain-containing protein [Thalassotalea euphylliae]REL37470.1 HDOD domain-containing protein [Thalassotalea euphylliae]